MATIEIDRPATPAAPGRENPLLRTHPSSEYWDHLTASWRTAPPIPVPRRGD